MGFVIPEQPASSHIGRGQGPGAVAHEHAAPFKQLLQERQKGLLALRVEGAHADRPVADIGCLAGPQRCVIDEGAAADTAMEQFVVIRVGDHAQGRDAIDHHPDRDAPGVQAVDEAGGAVDRVDYPDTARIQATVPALLTDEAVLRKVLRQPVTDQRFQLSVHRTDHVLSVVTLVLDLQPIALGIVPQPHLRGFLGQFAGDLITRFQVYSGQVGHCW